MNKVPRCGPMHLQTLPLLDMDEMGAPIHQLDFSISSYGFQAFMGKSVCRQREVSRNESNKKSEFANKRRKEGRESLCQRAHKGLENCYVPL